MSATDRSCISANARFPTRCSLEGRLFPAIIPEEGAVVLGLLCELETQADMEIFDDFEDEQYIRTEVLCRELCAIFLPYRS